MRRSKSKEQEYQEYQEYLEKENEALKISKASSGGDFDG